MLIDWPVVVAYVVLVWGPHKLHRWGQRKAPPTGSTDTYPSTEGNKQWENSNNFTINGKTSQNEILLNIIIFSCILYNQIHWNWSKTPPFWCRLLGRRLLVGRRARWYPFHLYIFQINPYHQCNKKFWIWKHEIFKIHGIKMMINFDIHVQVICSKMVH